MFKQILQTLSFLYETVSDRYETSIAKTDDELAAVYNLRKEIFGDELKRNADNKKSPAKPDELDDKSTHFICKDTETGLIIGAMRITLASDVQHNPHFIKEYATNRLPTLLLKHTFIGSRLILKKEYRRTTATLNIFAEIYAQALKQNIVFTLASCEPNLYPIYRKIGFCPLDQIYLSPFGGYRVPMFFVMHNRAYLERIKSPMLKIFDKINPAMRLDGIEWLEDKRRQGGVVDPGFTFFLESGENDTAAFALTQGFSKKGVIELFTNAIHVKCRVGDKILAQDAGGRNMGVVESGMVEIRRENRMVAMLGPGDIFGEIAFIIDQPRTADVIAATPNTEVVLLSASSLARLSAQKDRELFWKNISEVLAKRIVAQNARGLS